jgi:predicted nucleotidyltransferase
MERLERFLVALRPLLVRQHARAAYLFGSHARGTADAWSDIDLIIVAPSELPPVERFRDYLPAIVAAGIGVDLFVYSPTGKLARAGPGIRYAPQGRSRGSRTSRRKKIASAWLRGMQLCEAAPVQ